MPVRYDIAAQVPQASGGIDALNMMAAMRQQELQAAQLDALRQRGVYQDQQAQMAAMREARMAAAEQARQGQLELETRLKHLEHVRQLSPLVTKENYPAFVSEVTGRFPEMKPLFPAAYDPETMQKFSLSAEKFYTQFGPREVETVRDGVPGKEQQRFDFASKSYVPVPGSFAPSKPDVQYDAATSTLIDKTAGTARPVMMGGAPASAPAAAAPAAAPDMTTALIKQREGFIEKPKYDVNAYRAGYGSDTVTLPDGTVQKIQPGMRVSREDAERDLQRRIQTEFVPKAAAKVGEENWARLPENVRASLTSIAYNYGTIPSRIVPAVRSGNPEVIARAIESLAEDNKGVNAGRRMQEANIARGTVMPGSAAVPAFAAAGAPTFMGGPQAQAPINMMAGAQPPANAMAAPSAAPAPAMPAPPQPARPQTLADYAAAQDNKDRKESEGKAYQYGRMAIDAIGTLANPTYYDALRSRKEQLANKIPYMTTPWTSPEYRTAAAGSSEITDAILRQKSGATIHDPEIQAEIKRLIPEPGDTNQQVQEKISRQKAWIEGFIKTANPSDRKELQSLYDQALKKASSLPAGVRSIEEVR